jgi:hypothetical protein
LQALQVGQQRGGAPARAADGIRGDRQDDRREAGGPQAGEVGLAQVAGPQRPGAVGGGEVVAEEAGPDEGLDVEVDDLARPVQLGGLGPQLASAWVGGASSTQVLPGASLTSAPEASR